MTGLIYEVMPKVAEALGAIGKNRKNDQQNYAFRGIDDFINAVHGPLAEHGVTMMPEVLDRWTDIRERFYKDGKPAGVTVHTILTMRFTFYAPDGSSVSCVTIGEGADVADKASNKCMSAALKYALMQVFTVPTEDIADSDRGTPEMGSTFRPEEAPAVPAAWVDGVLAKAESVGIPQATIVRFVRAATKHRTDDIYEVRQGAEGDALKDMLKAEADRVAPPLLAAEPGDAA